jgi:hypothetical protein
MLVVMRETPEYSVDDVEVPASAEDSDMTARVMESLVVSDTSETYIIDSEWLLLNWSCCCHSEAAIID